MSLKDIVLFFKAKLAEKTNRSKTAQNNCHVWMALMSQNKRLIVLNVNPQYTSSYTVWWSWESTSSTPSAWSTMVAMGVHPASSGIIKMSCLLNNVKMVCAMGGVMTWILLASWTSCSRWAGLMDCSGPGTQNTSMCRRHSWSGTAVHQLGRIFSPSLFFSCFLQSSLLEYMIIQKQFSCQHVFFLVLFFQILEWW